MSWAPMSKLVFMFGSMICLVPFLPGCYCLTLHFGFPEWTPQMGPVGAGGLGSHRLSLCPELG